MSTEKSCKTIVNFTVPRFQACRSVLGVPDELSTDKGVVHSQRTFQARPPGRRDVRDQPIMAGVINMGSINESLLADDGPNTLENDQLNPNPSSSGTSESVHQNIVHDDIPFADDDDVDSDDEDENISWGDNVPYYPPRSRYRPTNTDDVDFCTIPCYPHCLVMFSSAPGKLASVSVGFLILVNFLGPDEAILPLSFPFFSSLPRLSRSFFPFFLALFHFYGSGRHRLSMDCKHKQTNKCLTKSVGYLHHSLLFGS